MKELDPLPPGAKLFISDAVGMYTNRDTAHGLDIIGKWLKKLKAEGKITEQEYPTELMEHLLKLVMENNIIQFGDAYYKQLCDTAMGTSVACVYAYLYSDWKEIHDILPEYDKKTELFYHRRLIDDIFGKWVGGAGERWQHYQQNLNIFRPGKLEWEASKLSDSVNYLDLTISIGKDGNLDFKTYQKEDNLHLYVPQHSAHPNGTLKSLIAGSLQRYWMENTHVKNYQQITKLLFQQLQMRGYEHEKLVEVFRKAAKHIEKICIRKKKRRNESWIKICLYSIAISTPETSRERKFRKHLKVTLHHQKKAKMIMNLKSF